MVAPAPALDEYEVARTLVLEHRKASASWLQRNLRIGYNSATKYIERMEADGLIGAPDHVGRRSILVEVVSGEESDGPILLAYAKERVREFLAARDDRDAQITIPVDLPEQHRAADDRLRLLIERIQRLEEEKKGVADDIRDVYAEVKSFGYDAKITRQIVRLLKMQPDDRREMELLLDTYKCALGIG